MRLLGSASALGEERLITQLKPGDQVWAFETTPPTAPKVQQQLPKPHGDTYLGDAHANAPYADHARRNGGENVSEVLLEFLEVTHERMRFGRPLLITGEHLLFTADAAFPVPASRLRPGDRLLVLPDPHDDDDDEEEDAGQQHPLGEGGALLPKKRTKGNAFHRPALPAQAPALLRSRVLAVRRVRANGMFAPLTASGRLFVDGVACSSFALPGAVASEAWDKIGGLRRHMETLGQFLNGPTVLLHSLGLPHLWMHSPWVHGTVVGLLEGLASLALWIFGGREDPSEKEASPGAAEELLDVGGGKAELQLV